MTKDPAPSETIFEKTLREAPKANERFESALPLVPGVVRGPDGRINLKGARATQSGALVNSANVTDPATGIPAINVPIDVVSSVQVISNPYDPQYGKLTGAVSTVETKTSNHGKFHVSVQNLLPRWRDRDGTIRGIGASTPRLTVNRPDCEGPGRVHAVRGIPVRPHTGQQFACARARHKARKLRFLYPSRFHRQPEAKPRRCHLCCTLKNSTTSGSTPSHPSPRHPIFTNAAIKCTYRIVT